MLELLAAGAGIVAGAASAAHCAAMCGPIAALASSGRAGAAWRWHTGRIAAYAASGAVAGAVGSAALASLADPWVGAVLSWTIAVALVVAAIRIWRRGGGDGPPAPRPVPLGRRARTPLAARVLAVLPRHPAVLGAATALLPCGALAAAWLLAAGTGSVLGGSASMIGFAAASAVALALAGTIAARLRSVGGWASRLLAAGLIAGALLMSWRPVPALLAAPEVASCPMHGEH